MHKICTITIALILLLCSLCAADQNRFLKKLRLPTGQTVVVAEGEFETRSIGSFSVRLYDTAAPPDETTFFLAGLIHPRDGVIENVMCADINGDQQQDVVITTRSVGTGNYLSAYAFAVINNTLKFLRSVDGLAPQADPVQALHNMAEGE